MKFKSINRKLLISVLIIALTLAILAFIVSFIMELKRTSSQTETMLNQLLDTVEGTAAIAAFSRNEYIAQDVLKGLLKNDIVYKAQIKGEQEFDIKLSKDLISHEKSIKRPLISPFGDGEILGFILVQPTAKFKLIEAKHGAISNAISSIVIIAITSIAIFLIIRSNISMPLLHVSNILHAIRAGREQRIPEIKRNKNDELGRLIFDINHLLATLENKYNDEIAMRKKVESIEQQLRYIFNSTSAGLFLLDDNGYLLTFNKKLENIINNPYPAGLLSSYFHEEESFTNFTRKALKTSQLETQDFSLRVEKGTDVIWVHCLLSKIINESGQTHLEGVIFDVTKRVEIEKAITHEANHDSLTGLLRRQATQLMYQQQFNKTSGLNASFLFLDLDGFKQANDTYGHLAGDKVLIVTSQRLIDSVRTSDIVCRLGGDEFLIILIDCSIEDVHRIAKNIISSIRESIPIGNGVDVNIGVSMGVAHLDETLTEFDDLTQAADEAMYEVKRQGKNGYCISNHEKKYQVIRSL